LTGPAALLSLLTLASAVATVVADLRNLRRLVYAVRPLTMILILAIAAATPAAFGPPYKTLILAGLGCSLLGDIFMMLRDKQFLAGLAAFLAAQLCYIAAFRRGSAFSLRSLPTLSLVIFGLIMIRILLPRLGTLKIPVTIYVFVIVTMAALAAERYIQAGGAKTLAAFAGAVLFVVSDSVLAVDRFVKKVRYAQALIMSTYFAAQWLIAVSV